MKIVLVTTLFVFCAGKSFTQTSAKADLKEILMEKRDKIEGNRTIILKDGTFQLQTKEHCYKFDSNGKLIGTPEENPNGEAKYRETSEEYPDREKDINYYFDGKDKFYITKYKSSGPNEYASVQFPEFADLSSAGQPVYHSIESIDDDNLILLSAYKGRTTITHKGIPVDKDKVDFFIRVVKVNIKTKEVTESFRFVNQLNASKKEFNDIDVVSFGMVDHKIRVGVLLANDDKEDEYSQVYSSMNGTYELWDIDLDSQTEEKIATVPVKMADKAKKCLFYFTSSIVYMCWTESIDKEAYSLSFKQLDFDGDEWKETFKAFPKDILSLKTAYPIPVNHYQLPNGDWEYKVIGVIAKGVLDKNPTERVFTFKENDEVTIHDIKKSNSLWYENSEGMQVDYEMEHEVSDELIVSLTAPLLPKSKMNYLFYGNGYTTRAVGNDLMIVHYDWRATAGKPDFMLDIVKLPL